MNLKFRQATEDDVVELVALVNESYEIEDFLEGTRTDASRMHEELHRGVILVALGADDRIAGCIFVQATGYQRHRAREAQNNSAQPSTTLTGYLGMLAVRKDLQGTGLSKLLLAAGEEYLQAMGAKRVEISVLSLRQELLPIYQRYGFEAYGTEEFGFHRALKSGYQCHTILLAKSL